MLCGMVWQAYYGIWYGHLPRKMAKKVDAVRNLCIIIASAFKIIRACFHMNLVDPQWLTMNRNHLTILFTNNRATGNETVRTLA